MIVRAIGGQEGDCGSEGGDVKHRQQLLRMPTKGRLVNTLITFSGSLYHDTTRRWEARFAMSSLIPVGFQFPPSLRQCVETVFAGEYDIPGEPKMPGARVLDIGANVGQFTSWVIERFGVSPQDVEAYEPNPGAVNLYRINSPLGCYVHQGAVTVRPGPVALYLGADWGYTSIDPKLNPRSDEFPILVPTVHPATLPACEILKIDAEGMELEILQNYQHLSGVRLLFVEIHRTELRLPCEDIAIRAGLELARAHRFTERCEEMALECWRRP